MPNPEDGEDPSTAKNDLGNSFGNSFGNLFGNLFGTYTLLKREIQALSIKRGDKHSRIFNPVLAH
jgi:hypothetical protein